MRGVGCDIVSIDRFKGVLERHPETFLKKTFTEAEIQYCFTHKEPARPLAARFAAKEAVAKALGTGFGPRLSFLDIEILKEENGKPLVRLSEAAEVQFHHPVIHLSISHEKNYATAFAIAL
jgi:holo-[acyl-carrier protein] synthase